MEAPVVVVTNGTLQGNHRANEGRTMLTKHAALGCKVVELRL